LHRHFAGKPASYLRHVYAGPQHDGKRKQEGLGIGLTLVKSLVELHNGTVGVTSPGMNRGSTFRVTIPEVVIDTPRVLPTSSTNGAAPTFLTGRVLIVDDNEDALKTLGLMIR
jgi:hypothetical protein